MASHHIIPQTALNARSSSRPTARDATPRCTPRSRRRRRDGDSQVTHTPLARALSGDAIFHGYGSRSKGIPDLLGKAGDDSHRTSWCDAAGDSVLDNLLSSLDRIQSPGMAFAVREQDYQVHTSPPQLPPSRSYQRRARSHTPSSSHSSGVGRTTGTLGSDYDMAFAGGGPDGSAYDPDILASRDGQLRRSSSDVHTSPAEGEKATRRHAHRKNSGRSSLDHGSERVVRVSRVDGSSKTTQHEHEHEPFRLSSDDLHSVLSQGLQIPPLSNNNEAFCLEPTIPSRLEREVGLLRLPSSQSVGSSSIRTKREPSRQDLGSNVCTASGPSPKLAPETSRSVRDQASEFVQAIKMNSLHSSPLLDDSALTPIQAQQTQSTPASEVNREPRPGFFRRVFGSSSRSITGSVKQPSISRRPSDNQFEGTAEQEPRASQARAADQLDVMPSVKAEPLPPAAPSASLSKKGSSFFRRRKRSVTDAGIPPALPSTYSSTLQHRTPSSLSANSLMDVTNPYLRGTDPGLSLAPKLAMTPRASTASPDNDEDEDLEIFHSGYSPPPDTSLRRLAPPDHRTPVLTPSAHGLKATDEEADQSIPRLKVKLRKHHPATPQREYHLTKEITDEHRAESIVSAFDSDYIIPDDTARAQYSPVSPLLETGRADNSAWTPASKPRLWLDYAVEHHPLNMEIAGQSELFSGPASSDLNEEEHVVPLSARSDRTERPNSNRADRVWLQPSPSIDDDDQTRSLFGSIDGSALSGSSLDHYVFASLSNSSLPVVQLEGNELRASRDFKHTMLPTHDVEEADEGVPTTDDRDRAKRLFDNDNDLVPVSQAASWLGEKTDESVRTCKAYMELFDWNGQNIVVALRNLCQKLVLRAETQQVDRILDAFSHRWCESNPNHGFKEQDVVHTICYSLLLLNTDLHIANIESKMTRNQFIKNTMPTIKHAVEDKLRDEDTLRVLASGSRPGIPWQVSSASLNSPARASPDLDERASFELKKPEKAIKRLSLRPGVSRSESDQLASESSAINALVNQPNDGPTRAWEFEIESVLGVFFKSIRAEPLPLHGTRSPEQGGLPYDHSGPLSPSGNNMNNNLRRTGSIISKAPSETLRGKRQDLQSLTTRWRSRPKMYASSAMASSMSSFDDCNSVWSPARSSTWSKFSLGGTAATWSVNSLGSHVGQDGYHQSIGFANALSQAIIREELRDDGADAGELESATKAKPQVEDESLELVGAPWAKEGILKHRHHLDGPDKKARDRSWNECFAVMEKGRLRLFSFGSKGSTKAPSLASRSRTTNSKRASTLAPVVVGGGNWMENAEPVGSFTLSHTIATTLPSSGFSRSRQHVWALSLPTGAVHLFHVGTAEIAHEFMSTANYWAARMSKEPLMGGVSNIEYGWGDAIVGTTPSDSSSPGLMLPPPRTGSRQDAPSGSISLPRGSMHGSIRASLDLGRPQTRLPGDSAQISDWAPPAQSMMASQLMEVDQLRAQRDYVVKIEEELRVHNELKGVMMLAFSLRHPNHAKATRNWEMKSSHLLREIVKFETYIAALSAAQTAKEKEYAGRVARKT